MKKNNILLIVNPVCGIKNNQLAAQTRSQLINLLKQINLPTTINSLGLKNISKEDLLSILSKVNRAIVTSTSALFKLGNDVLIASIDGVGTKSILAKRFFNEDAYYELGKDIVGHSINDILVQGADVAHNSKHTKMRKAQKLGITIMDEDIYYSNID